MTNDEIDACVKEGFENATENEYTFADADELANDMAAYHPCLEDVETVDILASIIRLGLFERAGDG